MLVDLSSDREGAPRPDPRLLVLYAVCARVLHISGATEFLDRLELDAEEKDVLASDGSSVHPLSNLLSPYAAINGAG